MLIDYPSLIAPSLGYNGKDKCPVCNIYDRINNTVALRDIKTKMLVHLSREDYDTILKVVDSIIEIGEITGSFEKNEGFTWIDIPLTEAGKFATLSVRKTILEDDNHYEWMLVKDV